MFKYNKQKLKEKIEITKSTSTVTKYFYEKGVKVKENEEYQFDSYNFIIHGLSEDKEYVLDFILDYPNGLLDLPLNQKIKINEYLHELYIKLDNDRVIDDTDLPYVNFYLTRLDDKYFYIEIIINFVFQYFKSLKEINYDIDINFKFNIDDIKYCK